MEAHVGARETSVQRRLLHLRPEVSPEQARRRAFQGEARKRRRLLRPRQLQSRMRLELQPDDAWCEGHLRHEAHQRERPEDPARAIQTLSEVETVDEGG